MRLLHAVIFGCLVLAVSLIVWYIFAPKASTCTDCNVILVTIDSLDVSHISSFGYKRETTPNLDRWAREALTFSNYITTSGLTPITQTSLQTGLYPSHSGIISFNSLLRSDIPTLPELLKKEGYTTVAYGSAPEYYEAGVSGWQNRRKNYERGFDQFFDEYFEQQIAGVQNSSQSAYRWPKQERGLPEGALSWLEENKKNKFFLWIPIGSVHWPYNDNKPFHFADSAYQGMFRNDTLHWQLPSQFKRVYDGKFWPSDGQPVLLTSKDTDFIVDRYDDGIYLTDQFLGRLFETLERRGYSKNTIVILTTEHGEEFGEHGYIAHYDIHDQETRVPLFMKFPRIVPSKLANQVSTVDILPTLLDALGVQKPTSLDGKSMWSFIGTGRKLPNDFREFAMIERTPLMETLMFDSGSPYEQWLKEFLVADGNAHFRDVAVRTNEWKLIYRESRTIQEKYSWWRRLSGNASPIKEFELYNLSSDPQEKINVIDKYPQVSAKLKSNLLQWVRISNTWRKSIGPDLEEVSI